MARLMSQVKGGYYAAAPEAVATVLERLRPPAWGECLILDPCAGERNTALHHFILFIQYYLCLASEGIPGRFSPNI